MNSSLMMLLGLGGKLDPATLQSIVTKGNERRRKLFTKLADLLFGLFMLIFGKLKFVDGDGKAIDISKPSTLNTDDKLNILLNAADATQTSMLYREFLRPAIVNIAELIATMMEPDENMIALISGQPAMAGMGGGGAGVNFGGVLAAPAPAANSAWEGQFMTGDVDGKLWHIVGGRKQWITQWSVMERLYNGRTYAKVPQSVVDGFPTGPNEV